MKWTQNTTIRSLIGAPQVVRHDVKNTDYLKLAQFYNDVDFKRPAGQCDVC